MELPKQLMITIASAQAENGNGRRRARDRVLNHALAYIDRHDREPLTVFELTQVTRASERTLQYAFRERFGISPKSYLRTRRLNGAHKELRRANPSKVRVSDAARQWGFEHMSQFAADYRRQFGELPSETLEGSGGSSVFNSSVAVH
jgi:AraC family ethanolamine operon transcriptional activator